jgi:RNA polymerase sigma factor (sigma-70 family)
VLKPEEREVFTLRWYHGLEQEEIAQAMGVSERTVKRYWKSAKEKLARHIRLDDLL